MYNKDYYERNKEKIKKRNLEYYHANRNNPGFMERKRENDKKYYYKSKIFFSVETNIKVSFL